MKVNWFMAKLDNEAREAIWQYMIDHSVIQKNGYYGIQFYCQDEADFWRRVQARREGIWKKYDKDDKHTTSLKNQKIYQTYLWYTKDNQRRKNIREDIKANGKIKEKIALWLYTKIDIYLFR